MVVIGDDIGLHPLKKGLRNISKFNQVSHELKGFHKHNHFTIHFSIVFFCVVVVVVVFAFSAPSSFHSFRRVSPACSQTFFSLFCPSR